MTPVYRLFFIFVASVCLNTSVFSQEYIRFGISDGLPSDEVTSVCQDKNYYWIGTTDGLCRYDGQNFKIYRRTGKAGSLSSNNIETLTITSDGKIWIGYKTKGVDIFDPSKEEALPLSSLTKAVLPHHVITIFEDSRKNVWLGSWEEGIFKTKTADGGKTYNVTKYYDGYTISSFIEKPQGIIWVGTFFGGFIYNLKTDLWQTFGGKCTISSMVEGSSNSLYYSTWDNGVRNITYQAGDSVNIKSETNLYPNLSASKMILSKDGSLILGTWGNGVKIITNPASAPSLSLIEGITENIYVDDLKSDSNGSIWVSTYGTGLLKLGGMPSSIKRLQLSYKIHSPISEIYQLQNGKIVVGTRGAGSFLYNLTSEKEEPIVLSKKSTGHAYLLKAYQADGLLLLGDDDWGLSYRGDDDVIDKTLYYKNQLGKISSIYNEGNKFWFGTKQNGFFSASYNPQKKVFEDVVQYEIAGRDEITGFLPYDEDRLWISSHNGLLLFNHKTAKLEDYARNPVKESVYGMIKIPSSQTLWLATSSGVFSIDTNEREVKPLASSSVLPAGAVKTIKADSGHNLWFSIGNQLFCYRKSDYYLLEVNLKGLITSPIISSEIVKKNQQEYLLLGSTEGITSIDLQSLFKTGSQGRIIMTGLDIDFKNVQVGDTIYGRVPLPESTENVKKLQLSYKCKWISFHFSETGSNILKNQYQYRITGFSDEWKSFDITQPVTISQLPPGKYIFEIKSYNEKPGGDSGNVWKMELDIIPPFWQTFWFYAVIIVAILLALSYAGYSVLQNYRRKVAIRISTARRQHELELLKEKESFYMGLSHDILTPFMLIQSPAKDLLSDAGLSEKNKEKAQIIYENANFLSNMFSTILDMKKTKDNGVELNISEFELINLAKSVINSFVYMARSKDIALHFNTVIDELYIKTDKVKLERILYNLLSNALKYTPEKGTVSLFVSETSGNIEFRIEDTGIGISIENQDRIFEKFYQERRNDIPQSNNFGLGLYIVKSFVSQIGGEVEVNSVEDEGTNIYIRLPLSVIVESKYKLSSLPLIEKQLDSITNDSKPILLLVEDNKELNTYLANKLREYFHVITAGNGVEALPLAKKAIPEIIVSDLMMPDMDGLTLCRKIKEDELLSDTFFVLLTAKNSSEDEILSYKEGVDVFIKKPIDAELLTKQMTNIASTRLKRRKQIMHTLLLQKGELSEAKPKDSFIREVMRIVEENMVNPDFKLDDLAEQMLLSKTVLHRKFKDILDETPNQFIRNLRLKKAETLLLNSDLTISEIAYLTGFNHSHYFIKCFKEVYEETPKSYRLRLKIHL